jgi:hypothetical protein
MESYERRRARWFVASGFALFAAGSLFMLVRLARSGYFNPLATWSSLELVISNLATLVAIWAWWWLTKVDAARDDQRSFLRRAFYALAMQYLLFSVIDIGQLAQVPGVTRGTWNVAPLWIEGIGTIATTVGFVMMAREFSSPAPAVVDSEG